jgi:hypothetical protein
MKLDQPAMPKIKGAISGELFLIQEASLVPFERWLRETYGADFIGVKSYQDGELYGVIKGNGQISFREYLREMFNKEGSNG